MSREYKHIGMKKEKRHLIILMTLCLGLLGWQSQAWAQVAQTRTIKLKNTTGGTMRYKITSAGTWTTIPEGSTVTLSQLDGICIYLEATPSSGNYFVKYTNLAGTSNHSFEYSWSFYVSQDCEHMANYTTSSYLIKASASPNYGSISIGGCCAPTTVTSSGVRVGAGSTCTLSYSGASGYYVETWTEGSVELSNDLTCTLEKVSAAHTIVANTSNTRILTRTATTGGSVSGSSGAIAEGTSCTVTATANSGYVFLYWTWRGKVVSIEPSYTFKMPRRNYVLKAHFFSNNASAVNGYYYFDLAAGPVYLTSHSFVGYRYDGTTTPKAVAGTHSGSNKYYVYQSQKGYPSQTGYYSNTGQSGSTITLPNYPQVKWDGKTWEEYVTNNTEVDDVTANWPTAAAASYRTVEEENNITITGDAVFDITLDNIWTTKFGLGDGKGDIHEIGGITITSFLKTCYNNDSWGYQGEFTFYYNCKTTVKLKNTSKMTRIHYNRDHGTVADNYQGYLKFDSFTEAGSDEGSLTLTFPPRPPQEELVNDFDATLGNSSLIGAGSFSSNGTDEWGQRGRQVTGVYFNGGTLYAGQRKVNFSRWNGPGGNIVACIGGLNSWGEFYINGGKLTAVANTNSAAIGGGGGYGGEYGSAKISITGGDVYAYNFGVFNTTYNSIPLNLLLPGTAIGGGSSVCTNDSDFSRCGNAEISITGGTVYAKSIGGVAIGGGSSALRAGGDADITINGADVMVTAISEAGTIGGESIGAGSGLGGGTGGVGANHSGVFTHYPGGNADIHIISGTVNGSSIGGGASLDNEVGDGGSANVFVEGGTITLDGRIGGGSSMGSGAGGNAAIYVTGGTLDCGAIGGGDSKTGNPGMVLSAVSGRAGVHIEGDNKITVKAGYIGGGRQTDGDGLGKATAYIDARHAESTIQGQFILRDVSGSKSGDHCYFTMLSGTIDNTDLGTGKYVMARPEGAAVYIDDPAGEVSISGGIIQNSTATKGGAIYANGGTTSITGGILQNNHATSDGGAIYANGGTVTINYPSEDAGIIQYNYADEKGGALYISSTGRLNLYGNTTLKGNHVPFGKYGGGVYLEGIVQAGNGASDVIKVAENYADEAGAAINDANRNNIYLPNPTVNSDHKDVITVINNGLNLDNSSVGFSVRDNYVPVIYCATSSYLESTLMESDAIFEDSHSYQKYYTNGDDSYNANYIYLAADTWVDAQTSQPSPGFSVSGSNVTISNAQGLAWLCSYVNNFNGVTGDNTTINVTLNADVDMSGHSWVPIGINGKEFKGTFNGNGHTITGIHCTYIKGSAGTGTALGLFGTVNNATIHDVFVNDAEILVRDQTTGTYSMGTIANEAKGTTTIYNCSTNAYMESTLPGTTMGGLVGTLTGGEIHSSWSTAQMRGGTMGGMVGTVASGANLKNSFANVKFDYQGTNQLVGGLVSTNLGTVENCYVREQAGSSHGSGFGWCVGDNSGTIAYCYIPQGETAYKANGTAQGNTCTTYGPTATPYSYRHTDNQMAENASNAKIVNGSFDRDGNPRGLLSTLNKWVSDNSGQGYATWMRTMGSPINGDYPIFHRTDAVCVGSEDNVALEYSADFNGKFGDYIKANTGTIYLYSTPARLVVDNAAQDYNVDETNSGKNVQLHIGKGVSLVPNSGKAITNANVNVWLDNSAGTNGASPVGHTDAIDWHFFSSALSNAPIGLNYPTGQTPYGTEPTQAQFTNADGYFPLNLNSYYSEWDLYAYSEPEYHWINLKRNSQSHWHEDFDHGHINYTNETEFTPGKGYMVALAEEGYLQAYGTLNTHTSANPLEVDLDYTPGISWTTRQGHNLLGNPYQSYLDFNKFAEYNSGLWENSDFTNAGYVIMDEDQKDYIYYHYDASANTYTAPRYLHPHQGFMVIVNKLNLTAKFDDRMRNVDATGVTFRDGQPRYPLVNLFATDDNGNRDMVTVELGRPDKGGAIKQGALRTSTGSLCCHYEGEDYALVFTQPGLESANIRFSTDADAAYTMTWDTQNGEFGYLHLVDNLTGADIDCLTASEYKFTSRTSDYASRFKLVFEYTGIEEQEDAEYTDGPTAFAYYANGEIHLTGTPDARARLQIIDMTGRVIVSRDGVHTVSTTGMAAGVYVLRLTTANGTRTQKIILN